MNHRDMHPNNTTTSHRDMDPDNTNTNHRGMHPSNTNTNHRGMHPSNMNTSHRGMHLSNTNIHQKIVACEISTDIRKRIEGTVQTRTIRNKNKINIKIKV